MKLLILFLCFSFSATAQTDPTQEVMMRMMKLKNALTERDSIALADVLADEVTYGHSTGITQTKTQLIRDIVSGAQDYKKFGPSDMVITIHNNTAIVTMKARIFMLMQGNPLELSMNILLVWVKKNNVWKLVARQSVRNNQ